MADITMRVWRGDASGGDFETYTVTRNEGEVVLDVIHRIQATDAPDLACRWNCKAGKCGSCAAEVNGKPRLMCMTRLDTLPEGPVTVTPMKAFPIIRDLVTDVSFNYVQAGKVPALLPPPMPEGGYRMYQEDVERGQEFRKCIECFMCQDVCHVIRDHEENKAHYSGPRFFIRYAELEMHPLDTNDRRDLVREEMGLGYCNITKCCTEVCPEHIKITDNAIIPLKERVVDAHYDPLAWLGRTIRRKSKRSSADAAVQPAPVVAEFTSDEWFTEATSRLTSAPRAEVEPGRTQRVVLELTDGPSSAVHAMTLSVSGEGSSLEAGDHLMADVVLRLNWDVARAISEGTLESATAIRDGRLKVRGDVAVLVNLLPWFQVAIAPAP